jgi:hypothetical protein
VAEEVRLSWEKFEAMVIAESRRSGIVSSDALTPENCLVLLALSVLGIGEAATEDGGSDDAGELDVPSIEFLRRFARHNCNLPAYSRLEPLNIPEMYSVVLILRLYIHQYRKYTSIPLVLTPETRPDSL